MTSCALQRGGIRIMKLFDKIKHGLEGSGVHTEIEGPYAISSDQPGLPLVISFRAKEVPVLLEGYTVTLMREVEEEQPGGMGGFNNGGFNNGGFNNGGFNNGMNGMGNNEVVRDGPTQVVAQNPAPIQLEPNVPVSFNLQVPLNSFTAVMKAHAGFLGMAMADFLQANEQVEYVVHVRAQVQGSSHHAHASHTVSVRSFGFRF
jgi:hypothetical protein